MRGLILAPGAGAGSGQAALVAIDDRARSLGIETRRIDFPYVLAGRHFPDRAPVLIDTVVAAATALAVELGVPTAEIGLGGRSMGGRMCSMAVAEGLAAAALVLVSYPLHPPARPDKLRSGHFAELSLPCLFVSGTADEFATPAELEAATATIPGAVTHHWIEGGDHGLRGKDQMVATVVEGWLS